MVLLVPDPVLTYSIPALLLIAAFAGFSQTPRAARPVPTAKKDEARRPSRSAVKPDAELERIITAKFAAGKIAADHFRVHVQGGVATIDGRTNVIQHKGTATRIARKAGVINVVNRIQISEEARQKAARNLEQGRRRLQVKRGEPRSQTRYAR